MSNISDKLDNVIEKLDGMTSETVEKDFDMTIASKIDHISKQLDYISGGGSGGSGDGETVIPTYIITPTESDSHQFTAVCDMSYEEVLIAVKTNKCTCCHTLVSPPTSIVGLLPLYAWLDEDENPHNNVTFKNTILFEESGAQTTISAITLMHTESGINVSIVEKNVNASDVNH